MTGRITDQVSGRYRIDGEDVEIGASAGWTLATPGTTVAEALERADRRMYLQKQEAR